MCEAPVGLGPAELRANDQIPKKNNKAARTLAAFIISKSCSLLAIA
jgi:hypothetical protein